jgi:hypothetical protein
MGVDKGELINLPYRNLPEENFRNFFRTPNDRLASANHSNCPSDQLASNKAKRYWGVSGKGRTVPVQAMKV